MNTVLVALDGSADSNAALPLARTIAETTGGSIWLLRVVAVSASADDHTATHSAGLSLECIAAELSKSGLDIHPVIREGGAAEEILHLSSEIRADVIVMRTRGRAGLERALFGSVAEDVLAQTHTPLVLVPPGGRRISHIHKLLVPVDESPGTSLGLDTAITLAKATAASVDVLHVVVPISGLASAVGAAFYDQAWDDEALNRAKSYVDAVAERLRGVGVPAHAEARVATTVAAAIVHSADQNGDDIIVMSTHALSGMSRAIIGSVADAVVRTAHCPVLLVRQSLPPGRESAAYTHQELARVSWPEAR